MNIKTTIGAAMAAGALAGCAPLGAMFGLSELRLTADSAEVVVAADAPKTVTFAAEEMTNFLSRVLGAPVPIRAVPMGGGRDAAPTGPGKTCIVLGDNAWARAAGIDVSKLPRDGFVTKTADGRIYIAGRDDPRADMYRDILIGGRVSGYEHATVFGVYRFLEDYAGCRFFFPGECGTVVPKAKEILVGAVDRTTAPVFVIRKASMPYSWGVWPGEPENATKEESTRYRWHQSSLSLLRYGSQTRDIRCCHGQRLFYFTERFAKTHPEYFALLPDRANGGKLRRDTDPAHKLGYHPYQLCHSSDVWEEMYKDVKAYLTGASAESRGIPYQWDMKKFGWNANCKAGYVDIMAQDGLERCRCPKCEKAYRDEPNYANDLIWGQTAKLARRLKEEGVDGYVTQMAYSPYARVPDFDLPDNILVTVARTGPWTFRDARVCDREIADYKAWSEKLHAKVQLWNYVHKWGATAIPDIPCMAPRAVGRYYQRAAPYIFGAYLESECDRASYQYLNYYVFSKIAWNPNLDLEALLDDHYAKMFGKGAAEMKRLYEEVEDAWFKVAGTIYWDAEGPHGVVPGDYQLATDVYSPARLASWSKLCDEAVRKNAGDAAAQKRVEFFRRELVTRVGDHFREYMDSISVEKALARRAAAVQRPNLIDPKKWTMYPRGCVDSFADASEKGPTGAHPIHCHAVDKKAYVEYVFANAGVALKPNATYRFSCFVKAKDVRPVNRFGGIYLEMNNGAQNWAESIRGAARISGTTDWLYHEMTFKTSETISPKAYAILRLIGATGEAWFDGVRLEEIE